MVRNITEQPEDADRERRDRGPRIQRIAAEQTAESSVSA